MEESGNAWQSALGADEKAFGINGGIPSAGSPQPTRRRVLHYNQTLSGPLQESSPLRPHGRRRGGAESQKYTHNVRVGVPRLTLRYWKGVSVASPSTTEYESRSKRASQHPPHYGRAERDSASIRSPRYFLRRTLRSRHRRFYALPGIARLCTWGLKEGAIIMTLLRPPLAGRNHPNIHPSAVAFDKTSNLTDEYLWRPAAWCLRRS